MNQGTSILFFLLIVFSAEAHEDYHHAIPPKLSLLRSILPAENTWLKAQIKVQTIKQKPFTVNIRTAKNVILFIGDGVSLSSTAATRVYLGGEDVYTAYDKFQHFGLSKTYCVDRQVPDGASAATALLTGVKNNFGVIGLSPNVTRGQCTYSSSEVLHNIVKWAQDAGKATGIVTTASVTDATSAAAYAQSPNRDWENDKAIPSGCRGKVTDIADQLVNSPVGSKLKVILGGGRRNFITTTTTDEEGTKGVRQDGRNLIKEWVTKRSKLGSAKYVWNKSQLSSINPLTTSYLLGLFEPTDMMYNLDVIAKGKQSQEPTLQEMTRTAIKILKRTTRGFFLLIEGGLIDNAHHSNLARKAIDETAEFSKAVDVARNLTSQDDTLIVVTADHSNVMTLAGYPPLRNNIFGLTTFFGADNLPYETLSYANGPGYAQTYDQTGRRDLTNDNFGDINRLYSATAPLKSATHGGEDVGVYANGPWAHLFTGSYEQNEIPVAMAYAAKIGPYKV